MMSIGNGGAGQSYGWGKQALDDPIRRLPYTTSSSHYLNAITPNNAFNQSPFLVSLRAIDKIIMFRVELNVTRPPRLLHDVTMPISHSHSHA
jgi:hypothetical protein